MKLPISARWVGPAALAVAALAVSACATTPGPATRTSAGGPAAASGSTGRGGSTTLFSAVTVGGKKVLGFSGRTVYTFSKGICSACGSYKSAFSAVETRPKLAPGIPGSVGSASTATGMTDTYDSHPMYFYSKEQPAQVTGNGLTAEGGTWHDIVISGG